MHVIFANATRGLKYTIQLNMTGNEDKFPGTFEIVETTRGFQTSFANLGQISAVDAVNEYNRRIDEYAKYDGIFFTKNLRSVETPAHAWIRELA